MVDQHLLLWELLYFISSCNDEEIELFRHEVEKSWKRLLEHDALGDFISGKLVHLDK